jgi:hypothetical protein
MLNSVYTTIFSEECGEIDIQIVAEHQGPIADFTSAEIYSLWDSDNEPQGLFTRSGDNLVYEGMELGEEEYNQLATFITSFRAGDWDL